MRDERPETGPMKFGEDWTGVFIRGDDAMPYALALRHMLEVHPPAQDDETDPVLAKMVLKGLIDVLESCNEASRRPESALDMFQNAGKPSENPRAQNLKGFPECLVPLPTK